MILVSAAVVLSGLPAFAATDATNTNTVSPTLVVNVTVQKAIRLTLATGSQCAVNAGGGGDYNINFGTVDALAIANGSCGSKFAPATPGTTSAAYYTDYTVTPVFTSQSVATNTLKAYVSTAFTKANLSILESSSAPSGIGDLNPMGVTSGSQTTVATNAASGVAVAPTNGASLTGADAATITYTLTVQ